MNPTMNPRSRPWAELSLGGKIGAAIGVLIVSVALIALATLVFGSMAPDPTCYACESREMRDYGADGR